jgi:hypothetical protein
MLYLPLLTARKRGLMRLHYRIGGVIFVSFFLGLWLKVQAEVPLEDPSPLVLAIYYAWYDESTWTSGQVSDVPAIPYASRDRETIVRHVQQAKGAGIDAFALSWLGPGSPTEHNLVTLLSVAAARDFRACLYFETDSPLFHSQEDIVAALRHVIDVHAARSAFLRYGGRPVIFFWHLEAMPLESGQTLLQAWAAIRDQVDPDHTTVWIAEGVDIEYQAVFDGHHLYSIAWASDVTQTLSDWGYRVREYETEHGLERLWVATVMPGYNDLLTGREDAFARDRENGNFYRRTWQAAMDSGADWVVITSWNEWVEGSQIEPSASYGDLYLDLTRELAEQFKAGTSATPTAIPSPIPSIIASEEVIFFPPTSTPSPLPTATPVPSPTPTVTPSPTPTVTPSPTYPATATPTRTATATPTPTRTATPTPRPPPTASPSFTPTPTSTATTEPTPTPTMAPGPDVRLYLRSFVGLALLVSALIALAGTLLVRHERR